MVTKIGKLKIVGMKEPKWVMVSTKKIALSDVEMSVAFSVNPKNVASAIIRIGNTILNELGWKSGDKIGLFYDEHEPYHWRVAKASSGNPLTKENQINNYPYQRAAFTWKNDDFKYRKSKKVEYVLHIDSITFRVPYNEKA